MKDEAIGKRLARALDREAAELGRRHAPRLAAARNRALASRGARSRLAPYLVPAAAALALMAAMVLQVNRPGLPTGVDSGDLEIITGQAGPELLADMDFYAWLAAEQGEDE